MTTSSFCGGGTFITIHNLFFWFLWFTRYMTHPLICLKSKIEKYWFLKKLWRYPHRKMMTSSFCGPKMGLGLVPHHFLSKDFEILDLDPPNNPTSHYGACHSGYRLALKKFSLNILDILPLKQRNVSKSFCLLFVCFLTPLKELNLMSWNVKVLSILVCRWFKAE